MYRCHADGLPTRIFQLKQISPRSEHPRRRAQITLALEMQHAVVASNSLRSLYESNPMQLLTAQCPYCGRDVETTIDHTEEPIVCPSCKKPFEMEIPSVEVTSVRTADGVGDAIHIATEPEERILKRVHPVVFRTRPIATMAVLLVSASAIYGLWSALTMDDTVANEELLGSTSLASIDWLLWLSVSALVCVGGLLIYWFTLSLMTTLTITDSRTIYQRGIIRRDTSEVQHDDVRNIQLDQSLVQRILRIGKLGISSSGQDDLEIVVAGISSPGLIVNMIRENQR